MYQTLKTCQGKLAGHFGTSSLKCSGGKAAEETDATRNDGPMGEFSVGNKSRCVVYKITHIFKC